MDYVISIENNPYMRWQAALFEESLRLQGLEDNLVVTCTNDSDYILKQKRVVYHQNVGKEVGYLCLNRAKGLLEAVKQGVVTQPFVSVDPDTFMLRPVPPSAEQVYVIGQRIFYASYDELLSKDGYDVCKMFGVSKESWLGLGCCYQFSGVSDKVFESIFDWTHRLAYIFRERVSTKSYWQLDITAYNVALLKSGVLLGSVDFYETPLDSRMVPRHSDACFVHYCNGCPPYFNKRKHNVENWLSFGNPLPFETILSIPVESNLIMRFKNIVSSYLSRNPDLSEFLVK